MKNPEILDTYRQLALRTQKGMKAYLGAGNKQATHDVRASIRRLEAAFALLPTEVRKSKRSRRYFTRIHQFYRTTTKIIDSDLVAERLSTLMSEHERAHLLAGVRRRRASWARKARALAASLDDLVAPQIAKEAIDPAKIEKRLKKKISRSVARINDCYPRVISDARKVKELHRLRRDCRRLRHLLKFVEGEEGVPEVVGSLIGIQDFLGSIRDDDVFIEFLRAPSISETTRALRRSVSSDRNAKYLKFVQTQSGKDPNRALPARLPRISFTIGNPARALVS